MEGLAEALLVDYERKCILEKDEIMIIISNSGRNAVPIEICLGAKDRGGLTTVAVTSVSFSRKLASRHSGGKNLYEIADYVLDTGGVGFGDTLVAVPQQPAQVRARVDHHGSVLDEYFNALRYRKDTS